MLVAAGDYAGSWVERDFCGVWRSGTVREIEHRQERASDVVKRACDALTAREEVFDEAQDRCLIGQSVIKEVFLCPGRDDDQRLTHAVTATTLSGWLAIPASESSVRSSGADAEIAAADDIGRRRRTVDQAGDVIVPAIGVVIGQDDDRGGPEGGVLECVDRGYGEGLLIQRI